MAVVISNKLGKKLHEASGASRLLNIFGNDFNPIYPSDFGSGANFPLEIRAADESYSYDFSTITPGHEVVTCLTYITGIPDNQNFTAKHQWYDKNNVLIFTFTYSVSTGVGGPWSWWIFSYVGYANWELNASGTCKCVITITGDITDTQTLYFTTSNVIDANTLKHTQGYAWVEGEDLHYTDYWGWEHVIPHVVRTYGDWTPGYIWIETTVSPLKHSVFYTNENGDKMRTREGVRDTDFSPSSGLTPGYIWIQNGYHGNYISFIDQDGIRYIVADGVQDDF